MTAARRKSRVDVPRNTKICAYCGVSFRVKPSHHDIKTYCSKGCMAKDYKERMKGEANPNYKDGGEKKCIRCGAAFHHYGNKKYCSFGCYNEKRKRRDHPCKRCGSPIKHNKTYCRGCNMKAPRIHICLNCKEKTGKKYDIQYCKSCRAKGLHKKAVFSVCGRCGDNIPGKYNRKYCDTCWAATVRIKRGHPRRKDANQNEIVDALEKFGCSVIDASAIGGGFPDLIVGINKKIYLMEVKNPDTRGKLNEKQKRFFASWRGQVCVVKSVEEALEIVS